MRARLLANLNWLATDRVLRLVGGLLVGVWVARYLGPEQYGALNHALAFVALFGPVAKLGMDQIVVRSLVLEPDPEGKILGTLFWLKLGAGLVASAVVIGVAWQGQSGNTEILILIAIIALGLIFNATDAYDVSGQVAVPICGSRQKRGFSGLYARAHRADPGWFSRVPFRSGRHPRTGLGRCLLGLALLAKRAIRKQWQFDRQTMYSPLRDGWPLIVSSALIVAHIRIDQVMIGQMRGNADLGVYSAAICLAEAWFSF